MPQTFGQRYVKPPEPTQEDLDARLPDPKMDPYGWALRRVGLDASDNRFHDPNFRNSLRRRAAEGDEEAANIVREMQFAMFGEERDRPGYDKTAAGWIKSQPGVTHQRPDESPEQYRQRVANGQQQARAHQERMGQGGYQTPTQRRKAQMEFSRKNGSPFQIKQRMGRASREYSRGISNWYNKNSGNSYRPGNLINPAQSFMQWYHGRNQ